MCSRKRPRNDVGLRCPCHNAVICPTAGNPGFPHLGSIFIVLDVASPLDLRPSFKGFEDILIPDVAAAWGFEDESWGNDACAQALLKLPYAPEEYLQLWVDYERQEEREISTGKRFSLCWGNREQLDVGLGDLIWATDDEGEINAAIIAFIVTMSILRKAADPWVQYGRELWVTEKVRRCIRSGVDPVQHEYFNCALTIARKLRGG